MSHRFPPVCTSPLSDDEKLVLEMMDAKPLDLLTTAGVAELLSTTPVTVRRWIQEGNLKALPRQHVRQPIRVPAREVARLYAEGLPATG